jgi:6-phosphogluconolactonase
MKTYIYSTAVETARALIKHIISLMEAEPQKIFHIAFSGGSTPSLIVGG